MKNGSIAWVLVAGLAGLLVGRELPRRGAEDTTEKINEALSKQSKSLDDVLAAVKKSAEARPAAPQPQQPAPEPPAVPQKVELATWTPIKGPKFAKVTIVEYSDFQ
jgi:protein-disulfide isomerase